MIPPLNLNMSNSASGRQDQSGAGWDLGNSGGWSVNVGGSGTAYQSASATGGGINWMHVAIAAGAVWFLMRRR